MSNIQLVLETPQIIENGKDEEIDNECNVSYRIIKSNYKIFKN